MLDHKTNLSKFKKIEVISSLFSDRNTETRNQVQGKKKKKKKKPTENHNHVEAIQYATKEQMNH